ncbi:hypothetical protein [Rodentibacter myodis]|uniref:hypothetical protein n=1 Tax=Rodentibacter myodis TaxID=1907939 RepID=UPI00117A9FB8|nr:hypothetical protein [Rodentibacter myodis]
MQNDRTFAPYPVRYGSLADCIDNAIKDIQKIQKVFWIDEDTEIYAGHTVEEIVHEFFDEQDRERILKEKMYGEIDLNQKFIVRDEYSGIGIEKTAKELIDETVTFPDLILTVY